MYTFKFYRWCDAATSRIRHRRDRVAVKNELYEHLEERFESFLAQGLLEDEAADKAIEAMGSAEELARQLEIIHNPFWFEMLWISRVLLALLLVITVIFGLQYLPQPNDAQPTVISTAYNHPFLPFDPYTDKKYKMSEHTFTQELYFEPSSSGSIFPYSATVTKAAQWHASYFSPYGNENKGIYDILCIQLKVDVAENLPALMGVNYVYGVDSLGNHYYSSVESNHHNFIGLAAWNFLPFICTDCTQYPQKIGDLAVYEIAIINYKSYAAEWLELHYDRDGRNYVMRIELPGGNCNG